MEEQELERIARRRANSKMGWYTHATVYVLVNLLLFGLAWSHGRNWAVFPAMAWGVGLAIHGFTVFFIGANGSMYESILRREREALRRNGGQ